MALLIAVAPAIISAARPGYEARTAAHALANDLRGARVSAIVGNSETWVVLDAMTKSYDIEPYGVIRKLPRTVSVELRGPRGENIGTRTELRFFPDGSSTGGSIRVTSGAQQHWIVDHWLTGRITIDE
jgi:general secretion pathway protein H